MPALRSLLERLIAHEVELVLVGGYAAAAYGCSLVTRDIDVACRMTPENLRKLYDAVADLHPRHRTVGPDRVFTMNDASRSDWNNLYLITDLGPLDCLGMVKGIGDFDSCLAGSRIIDMAGTLIPILKLETLIQSKQAMNRPRDIHAALELESIRSEDDPPPEH